jgi:hypothetical protein
MDSSSPSIGVTPAQGVTAHFWDRNEVANALIRRLYYLPANQADEDIVGHLWVAICRFYFPHTATGVNSPRWTILQGPYRGPPNQTNGHKPNAVAVRLQIQQGPSGIEVAGRDYLWLECKSSTHDTPSGWKDLINETTQRLVSAHPQRKVAVVVAIGLRMMSFLWDPTHTVMGPQLSIRAAHPDTTIWYLDGRLKSWAGSAWVTPSGLIGLSQALNADCITQVIVNGHSLPSHWADLMTIEASLLSIRGMEFTGLNSSHWSC